MKTKSATKTKYIRVKEQTKTIKEEIMKEFEKEFDYSFCCGGDYCYGDHDKEEKEHIKAFISKAIDQTREEVVGEIEGIKRLDYVENTEYRGKEAEMYNQRKDAYNQAIDDILKSLKEKE